MWLSRSASYGGSARTSRARGYTGSHQSSPSVIYQIETTKGEKLHIHSPSQLPKPQEISSIAEPISRLTLHLPDTYVGPVLKLCEERRGTQVEMLYNGNRVQIVYDIPYAEVVYDFFDKLKSCLRGYASMDYEIIRWDVDDLIKLDILVNGEKVDALSMIGHKGTILYKGNALTKKLKKFIPRQMYEVAIQAAIGNKIIARSTVRACVRT